MKPIPYGKQTITDEDIEAVRIVLQSDFLTQGPAISEFESAFADYVGSKYAIAVTNGTAALHLSAMALNVKEDDLAITTPITFAASANCIAYCSGKVLFADIDPLSYLIDFNRIEDLLKTDISHRIKCVIPVDYAGYPINSYDLRYICDKYGVSIIEDACHSPGAYFTGSNGRIEKCGNGNYSDLTVFSFHPVKHITTGEGGMITTNNESLYQKLLLLRSHGITKDSKLLFENHGGWYYEMQELGYNYRITDIQAALGLSQLKRADSGIERRNEIASKYNKAFTNTCIKTPHLSEGYFHGYHLYVIQVKKRKELYEYLKTRNIYTQVHYIPVHTLPYYKQFGWNTGDFPLSEEFYRNCLSLPMYPGLTDEEQDYVINEVLTFCNNL
jgi:UDP-4-amino-4,6-dideoxy-N-acetyl-beta-L-altrosamine transaminase